jgi:hypothetical protein
MGPRDQLETQTRVDKRHVGKTGARARERRRNRQNSAKGVVSERSAGGGSPGKEEETKEKESGKD